MGFFIVAQTVVNVCVAQREHRVYQNPRTGNGQQAKHNVRARGAHDPDPLAVPSSAPTAKMLATAAIEHKKENRRAAGILEACVPRDLG